MEQLIGRKQEVALLNSLLKSNEPELVAIYGRRRIGKTFLVRKTMEKIITFEFVGANNVSLKVQLGNFTKALIQAGATMLITPPKSWPDAFYLLSRHLENQPKKGKQVVFLDEFPWMNTPKSGFLSAFDHWWNSWANKQSNLIVIICGSAAAWMIRHVVNNKGGLHNRITQRIKLPPFTLEETAKFLEAKNIKLGHFQIIQLYMAIGGTAAYLKLIKKGESTAQAIDRLCFSPDGQLTDEFDNLYQSLFDNSEAYIDVIKLLAKHTFGLTRSEISKSLKYSTGGGLTNILNELEASGFIAPYIPYGYTAKNILYKVNDEFSLFYLKFMENKKGQGIESWHKISSKPTWKSWSGLAFERVCLKHIQKIKEALGLRAIHTQSSSWRSTDTSGNGAQIDLLIERADFIINLCEIKFSEGIFTIDKKYAAELRNKKALFKQQSNTNKAVLIIMITSFGVKHNDNFTELIESEVTIEDLF